MKEQVKSNLISRGFSIRGFMCSNNPTAQEMDKFIQDYTKNCDNSSNMMRGPFTEYIAWSIPSLTVYSEMVDDYDFGKTLSICCGNGVSEMFLMYLGMDMICTDLKKNPKSFIDVEELDAVSAVTKYKNDCNTIFISWPSYNDSFAYDSVKNGDFEYIIYIGEGEGMCCADDQFFDYINNQYRYDNMYHIKKWFGIHDIMHVLKKKHDV